MRRCGVVTASRFADILTNPRTKAAQYAGELSETAKSYLLEKLAELLTGQPADRFQSAPTKWGTDWESEAFEKAMPVVAERFGCAIGRPEGQFAFIEHATEQHIGCSPDGVIGDEGLLELKCPWNPVNHLRTVLSGEMPDKHAAQVQGSLWCTGRTWYAFCSYDPRLERSGVGALFVVRVARDDAYIERELAPRVTRFRDLLLEEHARLTGGREPF